MNAIFERASSRNLTSVSSTSSVERYLKGYLSRSMYRVLSLSEPAATWRQYVKQTRSALSLCRPYPWPRGDDISSAHRPIKTKRLVARWLGRNNAHDEWLGYGCGIAIRCFRSDYGYCELDLLRSVLSWCEHEFIQIWLC